MARKPVYAHPAWRQVRLAVLNRDGWRCQIRGPRCTLEATEADHIIAVVDGGARYDPANLRAACKACNSGRVTPGKRGRWLDGQTFITLVLGPPAAGKTTWVEANAGPDDLVIDWDAIARALGAEDHDVDQGHAKAAGIARNAILDNLRRATIPVEHAWLISTHPSGDKILPHHELKVIDPGRDEVHRRATAAGRPERWHQLIDDWYTRRSGATSVTALATSREW